MKVRAGVDREGLTGHLPSEIAEEEQHGICYVVIARDIVQRRWISRWRMRTSSGTKAFAFAASRLNNSELKSCSSRVVTKLRLLAMRFLWPRKLPASSISELV